MSSCDDKDPTLTPEWFEALISQPAQPAETPFTKEECLELIDKAKDMLARKCSRCGAYKVTVESKCHECEE